LVKKIKKRHKISKNKVLGHSHISPGRKIDPGPKFPWKMLFNENLSNLY
jgi:N-acetyl-anhydromuramyl-L-alanine amidase AmpD